jgi:hypothetical protein
MNWVSSGLPVSRVVDQSVSRGLVIAIVTTTATIARDAMRGRGSRIAGASWVIVSSPEKARKASPKPTMTTSGVRVRPWATSSKLRAMP